MIKSESLFAENVISARRLFFQKEKINFWFSKVFIVGIIKNTEKFWYIKKYKLFMLNKQRKYLQIKQKFVKENDVIQKKD